MDIDHALTSPEFFATGDPHVLWRTLRAEDPVHWTRGRLKRGFWSVTRHADVTAVLLDAAGFSSELEGVFLPADESMEGIGMDTLGRGIAMIAMDPPRHDVFRQIVAGPYTPGAIARVEARAREVVREVFDAALAHGSCDLVADIAMKVPLAMICDLMDIPRADWPHILTINNLIIGSADSELQDGTAGSSFEKGFNALGDYGLKLAEQRRGCPMTDTLSSLGNGRFEGRPLTVREIRSNACQIISAGIETTRNTFSGGVMALIENPDQMRLLQNDRSLLNGAVEEFLRYVSPSVHTMRTASRDIELGGKQIRSGDRVVIWNPSANRDELVFRDPYRFDITRSPNPHITFGYGTHFCLGAHLARLELRLMLMELLERMDNLELTAPAIKLQSNWLAGYKTMPVRFDVAA